MKETGTVPAEEFRAVLEDSILFRGMDAELFSYAMRFFGGVTSSCPKETVLIRRGEPFLRFGLVLAGVVQVYTDEIDGDRLIMANVTAGGTFGESLCYLKVPEPSVEVQTTAPCTVLWLSPERLHKPSDNRNDDAVKERFLSLLARRTLQMNNRIQVLSRLTLREKLLAFFSVTSHEEKDSKYITVPMSREDMAAYIGTNRSALSRELSRMKEEGILEYHKNTFRILK